LWWESSTSKRRRRYGRHGSRKRKEGKQEKKGLRIGYGNRILGRKREEGGQSAQLVVGHSASTEAKGVADAVATMGEGAEGDAIYPPALRCEDDPNCLGEFVMKLTTKGPLPMSMPMPMPFALPPSPFFAPNQRANEVGSGPMRWCLTAPMCLEPRFAADMQARSMQNGFPPMEPQPQPQPEPSRPIALPPSPIRMQTPPPSPSQPRPFADDVIVWPNNVLGPASPPFAVPLAAAASPASAAASFPKGRAMSWNRYSVLSTIKGA
jgi:hypothetical protein